MSRIRAAVVAATVVCGLVLVGGPGVAGAQTGPARLTQVVPLTGTAKGGRHFTGRYTIHRFISRAGKLYALGTVTGKLGTRRVRRQNVRMLSRLAGASATGRAAQAPPPPLPLPPLPPGNACQVLALNLGPLNLNLLGLVVRTNEIQLRIDAVQGAGNLLGNLLCGITNALNPQTVTNTPASQLAPILNALLALSPRTA